MNAPYRQHKISQTLPWMTHETRAEWLTQRIHILKNNPGFAAAAVDFARDMEESFEGSYVANKAMANPVRHTICMAILALYFGEAKEAGGAFLSSLQSLTTMTGICSKNTTAATVLLLERLGLLTRVASHEDRRRLHLEPTEQLISGARKMNYVALRAADALFPSRGYCALIDNAPDFLERYFAASIHSLLIKDSMYSSFSGSYLFTKTDGGFMMLLKMISLKRTSHLVDENVIEFPFDEIGSLFRVSRTHIRYFVQRAEAEGFVRLLQDGGRLIQILPPIENFFGTIAAATVAHAQFNAHLANGDYDLLPVDQCG